MFSLRKTLHRFAGTVFAGTVFFVAGCASAPEPDYSLAETPDAVAENAAAVVSEMMARKAEKEGVPADKFSSDEVKSYARFLLADFPKKKTPLERDLVPVAELAFAYALELSGEFSPALAAFERVAGAYPDTRFAAEALYRMGTIYSLRRQFSPAFDCFSALEDSYPASVRVEDAIVQAYLVVEMVRKEVRPFKGGTIPWFFDRTVALSSYDRLYEMAPHLPISPRLLYHKGMFAFELSGEWFSFDKTLEAIDALERMISLYPDATFVPDAYLELAKTYEAGIVGAEWDQLSTRRAISYYTDFYSLFPNHEQAEFAYEKTVSLTELLAANRLAFGDFYYSRHNNLRAALTFYNEAVTLAPDSEAGKTSRERIERIRRGERSDRTIVDWVFGRYPAYDAQDYFDAPSLRPLDEMGFRATSASSADGENADAEKSASAGTAESDSPAAPGDN